MCVCVITDIEMTSMFLGRDIKTMGSVIRLLD